MVDSTLIFSCGFAQGEWQEDTGLIGLFVLFWLEILRRNAIKINQFVINQRQNSAGNSQYHET
jgi:hypothetical protein